MTKKVLIRGLMVFVLAVLAVSCAAPKTTTPTPGPAATPQELHVGTSFALTGPAAGWGIPIMRGLEVYVDNLNARGGISAGGETYNVVWHMYDNELIGTGELKAFQEAILQDGCIVMCSTPTLPMSDVAARFATEHKVMSITWGTIGALSPKYPYLECL